jgi:hypothetical protein
MPRRIRGGSVTAHETKQFIEQSYLKSGLRDGRVGDYVLDRELSSDRAAVYHNAVTGKTLISNRGTTGTMQDWSNNAQYLMGTYDDTARLKHAVETQDRAIAKYGKVDTNIGHSQGAVITRKLNEMGKTGEVVNLNGASMFEKQKNNETRIRSANDVVSFMASLAPSRKRNATISGSWNPLKEHSAGILDRLDPLHVFGKGVNSLKKISFDNKQMPRFMPPPYSHDMPTQNGRGFIEDVNRVRRSVKKQISGSGGVGNKIVHALGRATVAGVDASSDRLVRALEGSGVCHHCSGSGLADDIAAAARPFIDRYTTPAQKALIKREARTVIHGLGYRKIPRGDHKPNPWLAFVKSYRAKHPEKSYKECLSGAAAEYRR